MLDNLSDFISNYIASRRKLKLDTFEKETLKRLDNGEGAAEIELERHMLETRYQPQNWLTDAARKAEQIRLVTHAAKFTHGDSKSSSIYCETDGVEYFLSTSVLESKITDAVGNAEALDVVKLLQTDVNGDSLLACLKRGDSSVLKTFAKDDVQLAQWQTGFNHVLTPVQPVSHKLAKQIYFPVGDSYHLLCPLFASSLAQAIHGRMTATRFGEEAKTIRAARHAHLWHSQPDVRYPGLAEMHFGGTNPQNISALNRVRGGRIWLLPSQPPVWVNQERTPKNMHSLFSLRGSFNRAASGTISRIAALLKVNADRNNMHIRNIRAGYVNELIDLLFMQVSVLQNKSRQGWTLDCPEMPWHQQLWLDPWNGKNDESFRLERDKDDWQVAVADDFARWLNYRLKSTYLDVGVVEQREWRTQSLFRKNIRDMEAILQEALK